MLQTKSQKGTDEARHTMAYAHHGAPCSGDCREIVWFYRDFDESLSGWAFMSGTETQAYLDDPSNTAIYSVNTIANYDPDIISFLNAPRGTAFERKAPGAGFTQIADWVVPTD
jgi:hypothetical protein